MKFTTSIVLLIFIITFTFTSCNEDPVIPKISALTLSLSKDQILGDGIDSANIMIYNQDGIDVRQYVTIHNNNDTYTGNAYKSNTPAISVFYANFGDIKSNEFIIRVIEDKNLKFEKNILLEQYTGLWCGYCPRAIAQIENLQLTDKNIVHIALHLSDAMSLNQTSSLFQSFGFTGVPTVHADRKVVWNGVVSSIASLHSPVRAGLAVKISGSGGNVTADIKVKFGLDFAEDLKLSVYLTDDGLVANQENYYNTDPSSPYYQKGAPMVNFVHRNVLIKIGTGIFGEAIPADSIGIGSTFSKRFNFSGINPDHLSKIRIAAFLTYASGAKEKTVLNSLMGTVGDNKDFVTVSY